MKLIKPLCRWKNDDDDDDDDDANDDDDNELFWIMNGWPTKGVKPF